MEKRSLNEIIQDLEDNGLKQIRFAITDIDGILRGKAVSIAKLKTFAERGSGFCNVIFGWDSEDLIYDNSDVTGWHTGFPDSLATIDAGTYRKTPWNNDIPFFIADYRNSENLKGVCPRTVLKNISDECKHLGYSPKFSTEYEWFNFDESSHSIVEKSSLNLKPITPGMFGYSMLRTSQYSEYINDLFHYLPEFGVPIESLHTETGDGAYEAAIEYSDVLEAADRSVLFKTGVKEIAARHGILASFMAKWNVNLPGSGGHIHQSLWKPDSSENLFYDAKSTDKISAIMKQYIAGQLHCLPYILPMYAPTVNSYKRFVEGSWASTSVSWGIDNRTTALRALLGSEEAARVETRVPGADANPYLAMAAALASGLYGIKHKLEPGEPITGNEYDNEETQGLPETLQEAVKWMKQSEIATELFGEAFTAHFIKTREWEYRKFNQAVTDWERKRYFEII